MGVFKKIKNAVIGPDPYQYTSKGDSGSTSSPRIKVFVEYETDKLHCHSMGGEMEIYASQNNPIDIAQILSDNNGGANVKINRIEQR